MIPERVSDWLPIDSEVGDSVKFPEPASTTVSPVPVSDPPPVQPVTVNALPPRRYR